MYRVKQLLMPKAFGDPQGELWWLIDGISQWALAVELQLKLIGPDAGRLTQILSTAICRSNSVIRANMCRFATIWAF